jgi:hypothetical protein
MNPLHSGMTIVALGTATLITVGTTGAVASGLVGSAGIRNNSVRSGDVRDGTLQWKDLRPELQAQIRQASTAGPSGPSGPAGPGGPEDPEGPIGPIGPAGPANSSIAATLSLAGPVASILGNTGNYVFAGPSAVVTTTTTPQRVTGSASASLGLNAGSPQLGDVGMCYQPSSGGTVTNFYGASFSTNLFTVDRANYATSATKLLALGNWNIGMCVRNNSAATINNNNYLNGWVQVTN